MGVVSEIRQFFAVFVLSFFVCLPSIFAAGPAPIRFRELNGSFDILLPTAGDDRLISLPISYKQVRQVAGAGMDIEAKPFEYQGTQYLLVKAHYETALLDPNALVSPGELFLVRGDGEYIRFAHSSVGLNFTFEGPLLVVTGAPRKLNLDQFESEKANVDQWPFRHRFSFANGSSLIFEASQTNASGRDRILIEEKGASRAIFEGQVQGIPDQALESDVIDPLTQSIFYGLRRSHASADPYKNMVFVVADKRWRIILSDGRILTPPVDYNYVASRTADGHPDVLVEPFSYKGSNFFLVKFVYQKNSGELYLVHEDGKFLRMGYMSEGTRHQIRDGILTVTACLRPIDLDRFEAETRYQSGYPSMVSDGDSEKDVYDMVDRFTTVASRSPEIMESTLEPSDSEDLDAIRRTLAKRNSRSLVLLGEGGSGKSETIRIFLRKIFQGEFPEIPRTTLALILDAAALGAGIKNTGVFEARLRALTIVLKTHGPTLLIIENLHSLRGQGTHSENSNDFFAMLHADISSGRIAIVADDTPDAFQHYFAGDTALYEAFTRRQLKPLSRDKVRQALLAQAARFTDIVPPEAIISQVIDRSTTFNALNAQPRSAIQSLEEVYADLSLSGRLGEVPKSSDVDEADHRLYQVDKAFFDPEKRRAKLRELPRRLDTVIIGQGGAKERTAQAVMLSYLGVTDPTKPQVRIVYPGERGQGKTELARGFAEIMGLPYVRIEMNHQDSADDVLRRVAQALRTNALSVILFDEAEKASTGVQNAVLAALDSGTFTVSERLTSSAHAAPTFVRVNARRASFFWATNAGESFLRGGNIMGFGAELSSGADHSKDVDEKKLREAMIRDGFSAFVLDRVQVAPFVALSRAEMKAVLRLHLERFQREQLSREGREIQFGDAEALLEALLETHLVPGISPRQLLEQALPVVRQEVAEIVLNGKSRGNCPHIIRVLPAGKSPSGATPHSL